MQQVKVDIAGPILSNLLYDITHSPNDLEGFLYGTISHTAVDIVEDASALTTKVQTVISIQGSSISGQEFSFYDQNGQLVDLNQLRGLSPPQFQIIGWFRYRRDTPLRPSLREITVHQNLLDVIAKTDNKQTQASIDKNNFIMALFTSSHTDNNATHTFDYRFLDISIAARNCDPIRIHITNLEASSQLEYNRFKPQSVMPIATLPQSSPMKDIISTFAQDKLKKLVEQSTPQNILELEKLYDIMIQQLQKLADKVYTSEKEIRKLEQDIAKLES